MLFICHQLSDRPSVECILLSLVFTSCFDEVLTELDLRALCSALCQNRVEVQRRKDLVVIFGEDKNVAGKILSAIRISAECSSQALVNGTHAH